jgi:carboxypeptidase PM20D1
MPLPISPRRLLGTSALLLLVLLLALAGRAATVPSLQPAPGPIAETAVRAGSLERLADALRIPTIAAAEADAAGAAPFLALRELLATAYPAFHAAAAREVVADRGLLFTWEGSDPGLAPLLLLGHVDVVPVDPGGLDAWTHPPFAGVVADGYVWGRGTLDDKASVMAILEAAEALAAAGHRPARTVLLALGEDEEVGGEGARAMAALLRQRGVRPFLVLDEGGVIVDGTLPGLAAPVALVGIGEKGYLSVELSVQGAGGHSSTPPPQTAVTVVARAVERLSRRPFPARLEGAARETFTFAAPEMGFGPRLLFANLWLTRPLVQRAMLASPTSAAMLRTTTAPTMLQGSPKDNVLPQRASAVVNFRIRPGESVEGTLARVRRVIDDERVTLRALPPAVEPSPLAPTDGEPFQRLHAAIRDVFPDAVVAPYLVVGATDARHYAVLTEHVFRFLPLRLEEDGLQRIHGTDERISVAAYEEMIRFYGHLLRRLDAPAAAAAP